ncbi:hypothetical protein DN062_00400 [Nitrincola tibetensis]|uniref:Uncharacterized protein n=1 Tax=Nitrincola tibetensis TaxID=2219697 RepID=A0A364NR70_9GAMM|nr:hypothetical protein [Nitrincola tibetensis]RAU19583.1 hypothetical protein DN062_00400 [Nitrincola tibetensis]
MKQWLVSTFAVCMLLVFGSASAQMTTLDPQSIDAYLNSLPKVEALGRKLENEGKGDAWLKEVTPEIGQNFNPHQQGVTLLSQEEPDAYQELTQIIRQHNFTSAERWAEVGDRIILAYGALKAESESPEMFAMAAEFDSVNPQMLQMLPPEIRQQVEQAMQIVRAFAQVSDSDKQQVRPFLSRIDTVLSQY